MLLNFDLYLLSNLMYLSILILYISKTIYRAFPGSPDCRESLCRTEDPCSNPGSGRSPGEGNGNPLQCSCLENSMDNKICWATVCGTAESDPTEQLSMTYKTIYIVFAEFYNFMQISISWCKHILIFYDGFPRWPSGKESAWQYRRPRFNLGVGKIH